MPIYNGQEWLQESVESILKAMSQSDELLLIDDGSTDQSRQIAEELKRIDARIKFFPRSHEGLVSVLNFGVLQAQFSLIARADSDDLYDESRLNEQILYLDSNPECAAVFCDYEVIDSAGATRGVIHSAVTPFFTFLSLLNHQRTPHPGVIFRKESFLLSGGYRDEDYPAEDYGLWIRMGNTKNLATVPRALISYRIHSKSISASKRIEQQSLKPKFQNQILNKIEKPDNWKLLIKGTRNSCLEKTGLEARCLLLFRDLLTLRKLNRTAISLEELFLSFFVLKLYSFKSVQTAIKLFLDRRNRMSVKKG
jgi:glycosyltransferase involved in cell wall biosynthesis